MNSDICQAFFVDIMLEGVDDLLQSFLLSSYLCKGCCNTVLYGEDRGDAKHITQKC